MEIIFHGGEKDCHAGQIIKETGHAFKTIKNKLIRMISIFSQNQERNAIVN